ncbi:MAG: hypothetical protein ACI8UO_005416 [Verrucomicrobiales bacterium]
MGYPLVQESTAPHIYHFSVDHVAREIKVGDGIKLTESKGEIDIEGVAAGGENLCYIVGSHGISRKKREFSPNAFSIWKLKFDDDEWEFRRGSLSVLIATNEKLGPFYRKTLQENGVNIEGLACDPETDTLYAGFRAPNIEGKGFVLEFDSEVVFGKTAEIVKPTLHEIDLGVGYGIRDIIKIEHGFLILAGNSAPDDGVGFDPDREYLLFHWTGPEGELKKLTTVPKPNSKAKPEALLLLKEDEAGFEVLVISDGIKNGAPTVLSAKF